MNDDFYNFVSHLVTQKMNHYQELIEKSKNKNERKHYKDLLQTELNCFHNWQLSHLTRTEMMNLIKLTKEELKQYDGSKGKPAYVAVNGMIYDVSLDKTWGGGTHFSLYSGKDLTNEFMSCHRGQLAVLSKLPKVGVLVEGYDELSDF